MEMQLKRNKLSPRRRIVNLLVHVLLAVLALIWVLPILWIVLTSFRAEPGAYTVTLLDPERYSGEGRDREVSTMFFVASSRRPIEMASVSAVRDTVDALARWTGGRVVSPHEAAELADGFGEGSRTVREPVEIALWCRPWLFLLLVALVFAEWVLRKMRGLV